MMHWCSCKFILCYVLHYVLLSCSFSKALILMDLFQASGPSPKSPAIGSTIPRQHTTGEVLFLESTFLVGTIVLSRPCCDCV